MSHPFALQVPADDRYRGLVPDVAGKYVELAGGSVADGKALGHDLTHAIHRLAANAAHDAAIELSFTANHGHVEVKLRCGGQSSVVRVALAAARSQGS